MTKDDQFAILALLKSFVEMDSVNSRRPDVPWQTVKDCEYLEAERLLVKYGFALNLCNYKPQRELQHARNKCGPLSESENAT